jgi:hypothetical protein
MLNVHPQAHNLGSIAAIAMTDHFSQEWRYHDLSHQAEACYWGLYFHCGGHF